MLKKLSHFSRGVSGASALAAIFAISFLGLLAWACAQSETDDDSETEQPAMESSEFTFPADGDDSEYDATDEDVSSLAGADGFIEIPGTPFRVRYFLSGPRIDGLVPLEIHKTSSDVVSEFDEFPWGDVIAAGTAPTLSSAAFNPSAVIWTNPCSAPPGDPEFTGFCTQLEFRVCDPDNDLAGGKLYFENAGTSDPYTLIPSGEVLWTDLAPLPDASDCGSPAGSRRLRSSWTSPSVI